MYWKVSCYEPERLADKTWQEISSEDFACKPHAEVRQGVVRVSPGINISLECQVSKSFNVGEGIFGMETEKMESSAVQCFCLLLIMYFLNLLDEALVQ